MAKRVVLAYSGGLDTSVAVRWMIEELGVEVDHRRRRRRPGRRLGGTAGPGPRRRRHRRRWCVDCREEFARDFVAPGAQGQRPVRGPLPAGVGPVAPGHRASTWSRWPAATAPTPWPTAAPARATTRSASRCRTRALAPDLEVLAPVRNWGMTREDSHRVRRPRYDIPITATKEKLYSIDDNLWGRAIECGEMEDPWARPPEGVWSMTTAHGRPRPASSTIGFEQGVPVAARRRRAAAARAHHRAERRSSAPTAGAASTWSRTGGSASRAARPTRRPAALALIMAHVDLETHHASSATSSTRSSGSSAATPSSSTTGSGSRRCKQALDAFVDESQRYVTGEVRLRLEPGRCYVVGPAQRLQPLRLRPGHLRRRRHASTTPTPRASCGSGASACRPGPPAPGDRAPTRGDGPR